MGWHTSAGELYTRMPLIRSKRSPYFTCAAKNCTKSLLPSKSSYIIKVARFITNPSFLLMTWLDDRSSCYSRHWFYNHQSDSINSWRRQRWLDGCSSRGCLAFGAVFRGRREKSDLLDPSKEMTVDGKTQQLCAVANLWSLKWLPNASYIIFLMIYFRLRVWGSFGWDKTFHIDTVAVRHAFSRQVSLDYALQCQSCPRLRPCPGNVALQSQVIGHDCKAPWLTWRHGEGAPGNGFGHFFLLFVCRAPSYSRFYCQNFWVFAWILAYSRLQNLPARRLRNK